MVRLGTSRGDDLVVQATRQRQVGEPVTVDVTHFFLAEPVLDAAKSVWQSDHPWPRGDHLPDQLTASFH